MVAAPFGTPYPNFAPFVERIDPSAPLFLGFDPGHVFVAFVLVEWASPAASLSVSASASLRGCAPALIDLVLHGDSV